MPGEYTIQSVKGSRDYEFTGDDGTEVQMTAYECVISGDGTNGFDPVTDQISVHRKRGDTPDQGDELYGEPKQSKYGWNFKRAQRTGEGRTLFSDGSKAGYRNPPTPEEEARMMHTSALSATPGYIDQMLTIGVVPQPKDKDEYVNLAEGVISWLESTYPDAS